MGITAPLPDPDGSLRASMVARLEYDLDPRTSGRADARYLSQRLTRLDAIDARIADCKTYNFGLVNADRLAHDDAPALSGAVRAVLELHRRRPHRGAGDLVEFAQTTFPDLCSHCRLPYPCTTVRALTTHLGDRP